MSFASYASAIASAVVFILRQNALFWGLSQKICKNCGKSGKKSLLHFVDKAQFICYND